LANFYLFTYEFDFIKHLLKSNTCLVVLHSLLLVSRFVDDLFVHQTIYFCIRSSFMSKNNLINLHDFGNANMKWFLLGIC
jgi:hypothetical protein